MAGNLFLSADLVRVGEGDVDLAGILRLSGGVVWRSNEKERSCCEKDDPDLAGVCLSSVYIPTR